MLMQGVRGGGSGLSGGLQQAPEGGRVIDAEGFQVSKVCGAGLAECGTVLTTGSSSSRGTGTILPTGGVEAVQGPMTGKVVPWAAGLPNFVWVVAVGCRSAGGVYGRNLEYSAEG